MEENNGQARRDGRREVEADRQHSDREQNTKGDGDRGECVEEKIDGESECVRSPAECSSTATLLLPGSFRKWEALEQETTKPSLK